MITHIIKRNGEKKSFDKNRIYVAIEKAFQSENINNPDTISGIMNSVLLSLESLSKTLTRDLMVEEIQDTVEKELMVQGYHSIARCYILYREQQTRLRQEKTFIKVQEKTLKIKVSETEFIVYNPKRIEDYLRRLSFDLYKVSIADMIEAITKQIYDGIPQSELDQLILGAARERIETHYQYSSLSSRIILDRLYTSILGSGLDTETQLSDYQQKFESYIKEGVSLDLLNPELLSFDFNKRIHFPRYS